ncbi:hypothetical protein GCM10011504_24040 [Siccirubricoccus deserti]|uniref:Uncharacterized protein n=1 Tax=Siccirubricoccus deserti TaxID=2013562 RepID=A0A9X0QZL3_9PROT|nr:hypothetical protein [Siccirubricoccus deserti]MBC4015813.1 hypothetical protein [Siccirubricoccus deserti]GGC44824.1 hypothetical protein GCM10011504_24040 [Siccirubricoccus deserti]
MTEPVMLEVRERRSRFGRIVKWAFLLFHLAMLLGILGTCALVGTYVTGPDPEVAMGAGLFGAQTLALLWTLWPLGTVVLGVLVLMTRGRKRLIPAPSAAPPPARLTPHRPGGSVPPTGPRP